MKRKFKLIFNNYPVECGSPYFPSPPGDDNPSFGGQNCISMDYLMASEKDFSGAHYKAPPNKIVFFKTILGMGFYCIRVPWDIRHHLLKQVRGLNCSCKDPAGPPQHLRHAAVSKSLLSLLAEKLAYEAGHVKIQGGPGI